MKKLLHLVFSFQKKMQRDQVDVYSSQAALFLIMSFVPMLMIALMMLKITPFLTEADILEALAALLNADIMEQVQKVIGSLYHGSMAGMFITAVSLFWLSGRGVMGIGKGLNRIYGLKENRNYFYLRIRSSLFTLGLTAAFLLSLLLIVTAVRAENHLFGLLPFLNIHNRMLRIVAALIAFVMMTLIFLMLYAFLPNRLQKLRSQIFGAVFTSISLVVFSFFFVLYLNLSKNLSIFYGSLLTIVIIMMWLYYGIYIFFFGAELNAWRENPDSFPI